MQIHPEKKGPTESWDQVIVLPPTNVTIYLFIVGRSFENLAARPIYMKDLNHTEVPSLDQPQAATV